MKPCRNRSAVFPRQNRHRFYMEPPRYARGTHVETERVEAVLPRDLNDLDPRSVSAEPDAEGEQKGHKGGCHRAVVAALLVTAGRHSRPPLRVPLRFAPVPAHPARRCAPRGPYIGRKRPRPPTPHWGVLGCPSRSRICSAMFPEIVSLLVDPLRRRCRLDGAGLFALLGYGH